MVGEFLFDVDLEVVLNIFVLGNINMAIFGSILGYFVLQIIDQQGIYVLVIGIEVGQFEVYNNIEGNLFGIFDLDFECMGDVCVGICICFVIVDIDNDGKLEMIVGNECGGLNVF